MPVARWCWVLVPMAVLVAGCLTQAAPDLPVSFTEQLRDEGQVFTAVPASRAEESLDAVVRRISAGYAAHTSRAGPLGRAVPVYGVLTCLGGGDACLHGGPFSVLEGAKRDVWLVIFPDVIGPAGDVGWTLVGEDDDNHTVHDPTE